MFVVVQKEEEAAPVSHCKQAAATEFCRRFGFARSAVALAAFAAHRGKKRSSLPNQTPRTRALSRQWANKQQPHPHRPNQTKTTNKLVELKNGETYNGHVVLCDAWMNLHLREVICTSKVRVW